MDKIKKLFSPIRAWKYAFNKPVTLPMEDIIDRPRESQNNARGFHVNDHTLCIGCGACSEICPTEAIVMVKRAGIEDKDGALAERPTIDYGRCCFCALCVDICASGSLKMSKAYLLNATSPDTYYRMPEVSFDSSGGDKIGYEKTSESDLLVLERQGMEQVASEEARESFMEILKGFSLEQARIEAARCIGCEICVKTCPANMHIPEYIDSIWKGDLKKGLVQMYETNPLPGVCGSVCTHKCETVCAIGNRGESVAIRWLKRYIVDNAPASAYEEGVVQPVSKPGRGRVAVVGGGPAGMSASYYLRTLGYEVDLIESQAQIGGVARYGVPAYRLPESRLNKDVSVLEKIGVKMILNTKVGEQVSLEDLGEQYDAVFLSTGLPESRSLTMEHGDHPDIGYAMPLLAAARSYLRGEGPAPEVSDNAIVIGGGNVAFDVARTLLRLQREKGIEGEVKLVSLETEDVLPADLEEIQEGREEGIQYFCGFGPQAVAVEEGRIQGLHTVKCLSVMDAACCFNPVFDHDQKSLISGSQIFVAVGQMNPHSYFTQSLLDQVKFKGPRIQVSQWGQTEGLPWLFAGGDIVQGPDMIHAIADGHRAARGIDQYLQEKWRENA